MRLRHADNTPQNASCSANPHRPRDQQRFGRFNLIGCTPRRNKDFHECGDMPAWLRHSWAATTPPLGELFRARTHTRPSRATNLVHRTQKHGDIETNNTTAHPQQDTAETDDTSAPENCTKNAHFSPAKAIAVSIPHRHKRAKATAVSIPHGHERAKAIAVSDHRAT